MPGFWEEALRRTNKVGLLGQLVTPDQRIARAFEAAQPVQQESLGDLLYRGRSLPGKLAALPSRLFEKLIADPAYQASTLAGRMARGEVPTWRADPQTAEMHIAPELQDEAANAAGMVTLGAGAIPAEANALRAGVTWKHPVSVNKLRRPLEEMTSTSVPNPNEPLLPMPAEPFDFASVPVGSQYLALSGDRTLGGQLLTGVNETRFKNPVPQQGGGDYMRREDNPEGAFWASHRNVISGYKNKLDELQEEVFSDKYQKKYPGADIYATTAAMAPESGDFSLQTTRSVMESMRRQPMAKTARDTLYDAIDAKMKAYWKEDFPEVPNWPGMRSKRVDAFLEQTAQAGKKLTKMLDSNEFAKLGGPDIGAIRKAITHPELLDAPLLATGHRIWRVGPEAVEHITDPRLSHDDYASQLAARGGEFMGGGHTIPGKRFWDFAKAREGMNESHLQRGFNMNRVVQQHTQEWLDKLMSYIDSPEGKKLGVAGAIGAGLLTSAEALELFGTDGSSPDQI